MKFFNGLRLGHQADQDRYYHASRPGVNRDPVVLRHGGREGLQCGNPPALSFCHGQAVRQSSRHCPCQQARERRVPSRAFPKHPQQKGRKQRRIHKREDQLQEVHDVVEMRGQIRRRYREDNTRYRRYAPYHQIVAIRRAPADVTLINVVREHRVEGRYVACHPRHKGSHERSQADPQHARRIELCHQRRQDLVIVVPTATGLQRQSIPARHAHQSNRRNARHDHHERHEDLGKGCHQRRLPCSTHAIGRHGALDH